MPVTIPEPLVEAIPVAPLLQAPPPVESVRVMDDPLHTAPGPVMIVGVGLMVRPVVA